MARAACRVRGDDNDPGYMSRKIRKVRTDKFDTWSKTEVLTHVSHVFQRLHEIRLHVKTFGLLTISNLSILNFGFFCSCVRAMFPSRQFVNVCANYVQICCVISKPLALTCQGWGVSARSHVCSVWVIMSYLHRAKPTGFDYCIDFRSKTY